MVQFCQGSAHLATFLAIDNEQQQLTLSGPVVGVPQEFVICFLVTDSGSPPASTMFNKTFIWEGSSKPPLSIKLDFAAVEETAKGSSTRVGDVVGHVIGYHSDREAALAFQVPAQDSPFGISEAAEPTCSEIPAADLPSGVEVPEYVSVVARCQQDIVLVQHLDFETQQNITLPIIAQDTRAMIPALESFVVRVLDRNDAPAAVYIAGSVAENAEPLQLISPLSIDDEDQGQTHSVQLLASYLQDGTLCHALRVTQDSRSLLANDSACFNYELSPTITALLNVTDSGTPPLSATFNVSLLVTDVNEAPLRVALNSTAVAEGTGDGSVIAALAVRDPDNTNTLLQGVACRILDVNSAFAIADHHTLELVATTQQQPGDGDGDGGGDGEEAAAGLPLLAGWLLVKHSFLLDYETATFHTVPLRCTDDGVPARTTDANIVVRVVDINEAPLGLSLSGARVPENMPAGTPIGTLFAVDPDDATGTGADITYCIVHSTLLNATAAAAAAADVDSLSFSDNTTNPCNVHPLTNADSSSSSSSNSSNSGGDHGTSKVGVVRVAGNVLQTAQQLNAETTAVVRVWVRAVDSGMLWTQAVFDVQVLDQNDPPTEILFSHVAVVENSAGAVLGTLSTVDEDAGQTHTYTAVVEAATTAIAVEVTADGTLRLAPTQSLDYERTPTLRVRVTAHDSGGAQARSVSAVFDIPVQNANEPPTAIRLQPLLIASQATDRLVVPESTAAGTAVAAITVTDPDNTPYAPVWQEHTCNATSFAVTNSSSSSSSAVVDGDESQVVSVVVQPDAIVLLLAHGVDYETGPSEWHVDITCADSGSPPLAFSSSVALAVENVNELPEITFVPAMQGQAPGHAAVSESARVPFLLGAVSVSDPDDCESTRCGPATTFVFEATPAGVVQVLSDFRVVLLSPLNFEDTQQLRANLTVFDSVDSPDEVVRSASAPLTIAVQDANDPITAVTCTPVAAVPETLQLHSPVATCTAADEDSPLTLFGQHRFTVTWANAPSSAPSSVAATAFYATNSSGSSNDSGSTGGVLLLNSTLIDYEAAATLELDVEARDISDTPLSRTVRVSIPVVDVDEPPLVSVRTTAAAIAEGTFVEVELARVTRAEDPEGQPVTCTAALQSDDGIAGNSGGDSVLALFCASSAAGVANVSMTSTNAVVLAGTVDHDCTPHLRVSISCTDGELITEQEVAIDVQGSAGPPEALVVSFDEHQQRHFADSVPQRLDAASVPVEQGSVHVVAERGERMRVDLFETSSSASSSEDASIDAQTLALVRCVSGSAGCMASLQRATVAIPLEAGTAAGAGALPRTRAAVDVAVLTAAATGGAGAVAAAVAAATLAGQTTATATATATMVYVQDTGELVLLGAHLNYEAGAVWSLELVGRDQDTGGTSLFQVTLVVRDVPEPPTLLRSLCGCRDNPCLNGGQCTVATAVGSADLSSSFKCLCPPNTGGPECASGTGNEAYANAFYCLRVSQAVPASTALAQLVVEDEDIEDSFHVTVDGPLSASLRVNGALELVAAQDMAGVLAGLEASGAFAPDMSGVGAVDVQLTVRDASGLPLAVNTSVVVTPCAGVSGACNAGDECSVDGTSGAAVCACGPGFVFSSDAGECVERVCLHAREGEVCTELTDTCASGQCENGATCVDGLDGQGRQTFQCLCAPGFGGFRCDVPRTPCTDQPCLNGGTCHTTTTVADAAAGGSGENSTASQQLSSSSYSCDCTAAFTGARCQYAADACAGNRCSGLTVCIPRPTTAAAPAATGSSSSSSYTCASQQSLLEVQLSGSDCSMLSGEELEACEAAQRTEVELSLSDVTPPEVSVYVVESAVVDGLLIVTVAVVNPTSGETLAADDVVRLLNAFCSSSSNSSGENDNPPSPLCGQGGVVIVDAGGGGGGGGGGQFSSTAVPITTTPVLSTSTSAPATSTASPGASASGASAGLVAGLVIVAVVLVLLALGTVRVLRQRVRACACACMRVRVCMRMCKCACERVNVCE